MVDFSDATAKFTEWLKDEGVSISPKVKITDLRTSNQGRGLVATEDIEKDEVLFTLPRKIMVNVENCALITDFPSIKEKLSALNHWESLIIVLLYELKVKKESSKWSPYFNVLPVVDLQNYQFNQLMFWSDAELSDLSPSLIVERVGKDTAQDMFDKLFPSIIIVEMGLTELQGVTLEDYHRVASIIMSYSFDVDKIGDNDDVDDESDDEEEEDEDNDKSYLKSMVPLADTLNADTTLHNAHLTYTDDNLVMRSISKITKGDQVYNTYSDHPNSEILRRYGYVEANGSCFDFGEVPMPIIKAHFVSQGLSIESLDEIFKMLNEVVQKGQEEGEEYVDIVLDSYDCFRSHEVIIELTFLVQILTIFSQLNQISSIEKLSDSAKFQMVNRIFKKCYQLIESKKLTKLFQKNFTEIVSARIAEYPEHASQPFKSDVDFTRKSFAEVVLKSEYQSLLNCTDIEKTFSASPASFSFIDDFKLIRNIVKRKFEGTPDDKPSTKKSKA